MSKISRNPSPGLSIGQVSQAVGVSVHTLRMWERRYNAPIPLRLESRHRRYTTDEIERLQLAVQAIRYGKKPSEVVAADRETLVKILREQIESSGNEMNVFPRVTFGQEKTDDDILDEWMERTCRYDEAWLNEAFYTEWATLGPVRFVENRVSPLLERIGDRHAAGELTVAQEHFIIGRLSDFLSAHWRRMNERLIGPPILLAGFPNETHTMGLIMCAVVAVSHEIPVLFIGPNTPPLETIQCAIRQNALAVCLSIPITTEPDKALGWIQEIRIALPKSIHVVAGGQGRPKHLNGVACPNSLSEFAQWLQHLRFATPISRSV